jgi:PAS domain S-box-containing protein
MISKALFWRKWKDFGLKTTEHRQAEYKLRKSQARYRTVVDTAFDAIMTITPDAIVRSFNRGAERIFGYRAEEVIGRPVTLLMPERYRDLCAAGLQRYLETGEARVIGTTTELVGLRKDGSEFPIELSLGEMHEGEERLFTGIIRDISERKQIEAALQRSQTNLAAAQQMAHLGSWESNLEKGDVYWSDELYRVFGFRPQEFVPTYERISDAVHPDDKEVVERAVRQALYEGKPFDVDFRVILPDGSQRIVHSRAEVVLDDANKPVRILGTAHDITEHKQAEEEVRRLNATLEKRVAERTAALADRERRLEELVGKLITAQEEERRRVAYEVHDSLIQMAIATQRYIHTFADTHPPGSKVRAGELERPLELVRQTVQEARRIVKDLRPTTLDDFGLATAVRQRIEDLRNDGWEIDYEETLGGERLPTEVEITLYRVTQEALNNVHKHARTTKARVALTRRGRKVRLEVRDEGRGFDPSAVSTEEGPVERVGLSSMRERVALLGGELEIRSKPGAGASVIAEVPLPATFEEKGADHEGG